ncbi:hypothetical protein EDI_014110 [Entamoeba dispar SAW760]|uniref:Atg6 BARA domain-containing protein n=1 Tax=Entamoeba dispar (strain ATCC PRA-260 / SAW760) TaxID=370354 RepID=B0EHG5_ENTDS|nr:uncharacterized protein EDI_014110 [Entamoeba dispar SAW760]EDR26031.1 hypothetical protein EDI_014110 [Entamoeba dispar SAW760]|eukprot:EDR26031.1 hypothetical protein EDI_014110 [Entamoeba dispar SAW760]
MTTSLIDTLFCVICGCPLLLDEGIRSMTTQSGSPMSSPFHSPRENLTGTSVGSPRQPNCPLALSTPLPLPSNTLTENPSSSALEEHELSLSPPEVLFSSPKQNYQSINQQSRKNTYKLSFYMKRRSKSNKGNSSMIIATPTLEFYQWFASMVEQYSDFGIPCKTCFNKVKEKYINNKNELNQYIEIYQLSACTLFQNIADINQELKKTEQETEELIKEIQNLEFINEHLLQEMNNILKISDIIQKHIIESYKNENQIISIGYQAYEKVLDQKRINNQLILPLQKTLTWNQLFQRREIVPEMSSISIINIVKSIPISSILGILFLQIKILANMINYHFSSVIIEPIDKQKKTTSPIITSRNIIVNTKKSNKFVLQCLLTLLTELSTILVKESSQSFFLIYPISGETINGLDFIGYESKKWSQALDCFLTNTEYCYKWIIRHYK